MPLASAAAPPNTIVLASRSATSTRADIAWIAPAPVLRTPSVMPSPRVVLAIASHSRASRSTRRGPGAPGA
jgi:hypothetical protein